MYFGYLSLAKKQFTLCLVDMEIVLPWQQRHVQKLCYLKASLVAPLKHFSMGQLQSVIKVHYFGSIFTMVTKKYIYYIVVKMSIEFTFDVLIALTNSNETLQVIEVVTMATETPL